MMTTEKVDYLISTPFDYSSLMMYQCKKSMIFIWGPMESECTFILVEFLSSDYLGTHRWKYGDDAGPYPHTIPQRICHSASKPTQKE